MTEAEGGARHARRYVPNPERESELNPTEAACCLPKPKVESAGLALIDHA